MIKKIFQAGQYVQGNVSIQDIKDAIAKTVGGAPVILGHVGDWLKNKIPRTAIPRAGTVKDFSLLDDFLAGNVELNEFGNIIVGEGAYNNMSIGFRADGSIDHLALLGYAEPACKYIDSLSKSDLAFSENSDIIIEYAIQNNIEEVKKLTLEELKMSIDSSTELTTKEKKELIEHLVEKSGFGIDEKSSIIEEVMGTITEEEKSKMKIALGYGSYAKLETKEDKLKVFGELKAEFAEQPKQKTEEEIRAEVKAEYAEIARQEKEYSELEKIIDEKVFPAYQEPMKKYAKILVSQKEMLEFSDESGTTKEREAERMKRKLEGMQEFSTEDFKIVTKKSNNKTDAEKMAEIAQEVKDKYKNI